MFPGVEMFAWMAATNSRRVGLPTNDDGNLFPG
jgi:hypothetical protein